MSGIHLFRVPLGLIHIDSRYLRPSDYDKMAVIRDLVHFVGLSQVLPGPIQVTHQESKLFLVDGEPFVRAGRSVTPPIERAICSTTDNLALIYRDVVPTTAKDLLDEEDRLLQEAKTNVLYFSRSLDEPSIRSIIHMLSQIDLGLSELRTERLDGRTIVCWKMRPINMDNRHARALAKLINGLSLNYPVSSWNGIQGFQEADVGQGRRWPGT